MRTSLVAVASLSFLALVATAGNSAPRPYHDPVLAYSMVFDDSCKLTVNGHKSAQDKSEWYLEWHAPDTRQMWTLSLTADAATTYPDSRLMAQEMTASLKRDIPNLQVLHDPVVFPGLSDTWTFEWLATRHAVKVHGAQYLTLSARQQRVYVFTATAPAAQYEAYRTSWEKVLSTFKFDF